MWQVVSRRSGGPRPGVRAGLVLLGALAGLAGCADAEGVRDDGDRGEVNAPKALWPDRHPSPAAPGQSAGDATVVPGVAVPEGGMRGADVLGLVRADIESATRADGGTGRLVDPRAAQRLAQCPEDGPPPADCAVRPPVFHDLTGDGKDELITAVDVDGRLSELRVYTVQGGKVVRVLARRGVLEGVEVAAGHLAVREPTTNPSYVSVSDYEWDPDTRTMTLQQLTLDDCPSLPDPDRPCPNGGG
ncbi:hypothetical protein LG634_01025 [Streptomyces bambusae]|uniref:hypothetical protein n=1 Tax=Streptomyces bambusae TaxID=1550616 RepID=UPI001CFE4864|nr:hypothetical protein [Streptomyces bambusae]MCB5163436.1 hypothetical protein [Streptomyces bambusae]